MAPSQIVNASPPPSSGPLPKCDSVQSLVSLMSCGSTPPALPTVPHATIRAVDADGEAHAVPVTDSVSVVTLSAKRLHTVSLGALASPVAGSLRELSLAANALDTIDLAPLSWCSSLTVLMLNSNRLSSIDLAPLAACKRLERLWLHDNNLQQIDLAPLASCPDLRSLYLEDNSLHDVALDLSPLGNAHNLRSFRLGGNRLTGLLNLTPLFQCSSLSNFNVDASVSLTADADSSQTASSPALRRVALDVKFQPPAPARPRPSKGVTTPPSTPPSGFSSPRQRRKTSLSPSETKNPPSPASTAPSAASTQHPIVKVLLVGFRRLARYAAEDSFARCGKVIISASTHAVSSTDPALLFNSHLVLLYSPPESALRQLHNVAPHIPTVVIGSERYRSTADNQLLDLLQRFKFYSDPMDDNDTKLVYLRGVRFASGEVVAAMDRNDSSPQNLPERHYPSRNLQSSKSSKALYSGAHAMRKSVSESRLSSASCNEVDIELEDIEDIDDNLLNHSRSVDGLGTDAFDGDRKGSGWSEVRRRLHEMRMRRTIRGYGSTSAHETSLRRNKNRVECSAVKSTFNELGGYATGESCTGIARVCGLAKCSGPLLFRAAYGSSFEIEATTPEAGVPNTAMERKKRISCDSFLDYWESRLKNYDSEERLSNVLEDSHFARLGVASGFDDVGHSAYGAQPRCVRENADVSTRLWSLVSGSGSGDSTPTMSTDMWCPCDAGVEELIQSFMEGRTSRFGSYALVKKSEAIAIGSALVMFALRGTHGGRVGGRARAICPKEVKNGKLNASLVAAEVGIFEGVTAGLSMNQIRSIKGCFATEVSPSAVSNCSGCALSWSLSREEVMHFCASRKTLLPSAVECVMRTHCRDSQSMKLAEFAVLLSVLKDLSSDGAMDYFFSVIDLDEDERWTYEDLRHFHMEKERLWCADGMVISDLYDLWISLLDMVGVSNEDGVARRRRRGRGVTRRDLRKLCGRDRKATIQTLLFVDDDYSSVNIRRTMEMNKNSTSPLPLM